MTIGGMGATAPFPGVGSWQAVFAEFLIAVFLMPRILAFVVHDRTPDDFAELAVGIVIATEILATENVIGSSVRSHAGPQSVRRERALRRPDLWLHAWIYLVGPIAVAITGTVTYRRIVLESTR